MAGAKVPAPADPMGTAASWTNILARLEKTYKGYEGVSLTNWAAANTDRPEIAAGSVIEIDGAPFEYATDETIVDEAGLTDGWCYIKHVVSGDAVTPTLTNTFGTWDTAKQGFYDGSGNRFSLFAMYRSGAITKIYTLKSVISNNGILIQTPLQTDINGQGHIEYDSTYFPGEKIKYKIIDYSTQAGSTSNLVNHGINNAADLERIIDVRFLLRRNSFIMDIFEGYMSPGLSIHTYYYTNTQITLNLAVAAAVNSTGKLIITYV